MFLHIVRVAVVVKMPAPVTSLEFDPLFCPCVRREKPGLVLTQSDQ